MIRFQNYGILNIKDNGLCCTRYINPRQSLTKPIDRMARYLAQLKAMNDKINETLAMGILVASIEVPTMKAAVAAIKTLA